MTQDVMIIPSSRTSEATPRSKLKSLRRVYKWKLKLTIASYVLQVEIHFLMEIVKHFFC